jgi:hypothetical protein
VNEPGVPRVPGEMRASDQERDRAVKLLGEHAAVGRLTLAELEERVSVALTATTRGELEALTRDLPETAGVPSGRRNAARWMVAVLGGSHRRGRFRLHGAVNVVAVMGGDDIDLREAEIDGGQVTLNIVSVMGGHNIYVPDTVEVEVSGFSLMGGDNEYGARRQPLPGAPVVQIRSYNFMGGSNIYRLPPQARGVSLKQARRMAKAAGRTELPPRA